VNHEYNSKTRGLFPKSAIGLGPWVDLENSRVFFAKPCDFLNYFRIGKCMSQIHELMDLRNSGQSTKAMDWVYTPSLGI
jgi:hypothetical protein